MLFSIFLNVLASSTVALGHAAIFHPSGKSTSGDNHLVRRQDPGALNALERAANSRLPNVPLPDQISDSSKHLLQYMAIWNEIEVSMYHNTTVLLAQNATGYDDFNRWNRSEIQGIMTEHQAESQLWLNYTVGLLEHYSIPVPSGCRFKIPLTGFSIVNDLLAFQQLNTLFIDSLQDASSSVESSLIPTLWSISTSRASQNGFYKLFDNEFPSERAFMTSLPADFAWSSIIQVLRDCPFNLGDILPVAAPLFADRFNSTLSYCANLTRPIPLSSLGNLYLSINVGLQEPITIKAVNVTLNGTIIEFDAEYPREEDVLEGLVNTALVEGNQTLASAWIQIEQPLSGDQGVPGQLTCPRNGGTLFWDFIGP